MTFQTVDIWPAPSRREYPGRRATRLNGRADLPNGPRDRVPTAESRSWTPELLHPPGTDSNHVAHVRRWHQV